MRGGFKALAVWAGRRGLLVFATVWICIDFLHFCLDRPQAHYFFDSFGVFWISFVHRRWIWNLYAQFVWSLSDLSSWWLVWILLDWAHELQWWLRLRRGAWYWGCVWVRKIGCFSFALTVIFRGVSKSAVDLDHLKVDAFTCTWRGYFVNTSWTSFLLFVLWCNGEVCGKFSLFNTLFLASE